jgi:hypothetical protein
MDQGIVELREVEEGVLGWTGAIADLIFGLSLENIQCTFPLNKLRY